MNYFLHYNNAEPLFIGGAHHGQKHRVDPGAPYWRLAVRPEPNFGSLKRLAEAPVFDPIPIHTYRRERIDADDRTFIVYVHEWLSSDAAIMLLLSTCADVPGMRQRIADLEAENRTLRGIIAAMTANA